MTSVPPPWSGPRDQPRPTWGWDRPTIQNPVYRDPEPPWSPPENAAEPPEKAPETPTGDDRGGRRGNAVIGALLVAGLVLVGIAGVFVSSSSGSAGDGDGDAGGDTGAPTDDADAATPDVGTIIRGPDEDTDDSDSDSDDATRLPRIVRAEYGETVTVVDGLAVTFHPPRSFVPSPDSNPPADSDRFLSMEVTAVNRTDRTHELAPTIWATGDPAVHDTDDPAGLTRYPAVEDDHSGLTDAWNGRIMAPGGTAYGLFGFGLPADAPEEVYGIVRIVSADDEEIAIIFGPG